MPTIGRLDVELRGRTRRFESAMNRSAGRVASFQSRMLSLGRTAGALGGGLFFGRLIKQTLVETERMGQLSQRLGVSVDQFSRLSRIMQRAGIGMGQTANFLQRLQRRAVDASEGNEQLGSAFSELGINVDDFLRLDPISAFVRLGKALSDVESPAKRIQLAFKLLDTEGVQALQADLGNLREDMAKTAPVTDAQSKSVTRLMRAWAQLGESVSSAINAMLESFRVFDVTTSGLDAISNFLDQSRTQGFFKTYAKTVVQNYAESLASVAGFLGLQPPEQQVTRPHLRAPMTGTIGGSRSYESMNLDRTNMLLEQIRSNTLKRGAIAQ